jgi:DNA-binding CsgD family transcriptional regulator
MKRFLSVLLSVTFYSGIYASEIDSLMVSLDSAIAANKTYMQSKELRLKSLKLLVGKPGMTSEQTYAVNELLYQEYVKYNFDSTLRYINLNLTLAESLKNPEMINETKFHLSHLLSASGMYSESLEILGGINPKELNSKLKLDYYSCYQQVYAELGLYTALKNGDRYFAISGSYRDSLLAELNPNSNEYLLLREAKLQDEGHVDESLKINTILLSRVTNTDPDFALYAFQRAISYRIKGDHEVEKKYLILSATADIRSAVKDNVSLTLLAILLFDQKDIDLAYKYIMFSLEDAKFYNSRLRFVEISRILPLISQAFQVKNDKQKAQLRLYAIALTLLTALLIFALLLMYNQMKKLSKARKDLQKANAQLYDLSQDLFTANAQLKSLNHELFESNHIKEEHIGFFLNMCSTYIDKLEDFRKMTHRKVSTGQFEDLFNLTKSAHFFDSELKEFYTNFDTTFLHIFPNFVEQFNLLLADNERLVLKPEELLNTELRIFALIRLGITDSSKIASFLRYSINTIYNYRTRVRNKAAVPRDDFEHMVRNIGISET